MVTDRFALLIGETAGDALATAAWEAMTAPDAAFDDVLSVIAAAGIGSLPDFALVELVDAASSSVSVAVRGSATIDLHGPQRSTYAGRGAGTWVEGSAQHVGGISLALTTVPDSSVLPLGRGIVRADALRWGLTGERERSRRRSAHTGAGDVSHASPDPVTESPAERAALETISIDRAALAEVVGPRRRSRQSSAPLEAEAGTPDVDDRTMLGARRSGGGVTDAPAERRYVLRLDPGEELALDRPIVLGRSPRADRHPGVRVVSVSSPRKEVSGTHVQVRLDGDVLEVRDLDSTNGTIIRDPAGEAVLLRGGAVTSVAPGTVLDLGDGVTATFESRS